jgi:hypothetical protein
MMRILVVLAVLLIQLADAGQVTLLTMYGDTPADADLVAFRDGLNGDWRTAEGERGTYGFTVLSDVYSLAILCFPSDGPVTTIYTFTPAELPFVRHTCPPVIAPSAAWTGPEVTLSGQITGLGTAGPGMLEFIDVTAGWQNTFARERQYSLRVPVATPVDLFALHISRGEPDVRAVLVRDLKLPGDTELDLDFNGPDALILEPHSLLAAEVRGSALMASLRTCNGTSISLQNPYQQNVEEPSYLALPAVARRECDRYEFTIFSQVTDSTDPGASGSNNRVVFHFNSSPLEVLPLIPAAAIAPCLQRESAAALQVSWQQQDASFYLFRFSLPGEQTINWDVLRSASLPPELELPQASELPGWPQALALTDGLLNWSFATVSSPAGPSAALAMMKLVDAPGSAPPGNTPDPAELSLSGRDGVLAAGAVRTTGSCPPY